MVLPMLMLGYKFLKPQKYPKKPHFFTQILQLYHLMSSHEYTFIFLSFLKRSGGSFLKKYCAELMFALKDQLQFSRRLFSSIYSKLECLWKDETFIERDVSICSRDKAQFNCLWGILTLFWSYFLTLYLKGNFIV